ncbi:MAG: DUF4876 domain-containing protein [Caldithrix sp.]|nr:DUF4876 domain-containing protein [Caldithrix sp.]
MRRLTNKLVKIGIYIVALPGLFLFCKEKLTQTDSRQFTLQVTVQDTSFVTRSIFEDSSHTAVPGARVKLMSLHHDLIYEAVTESEGSVWLKNIVPGMYNCTVTKLYTRDTVKKYLPLDQDISLSASMSAIPLEQSGEPIRVTVEPIFSSNVVISEIYYNGAPSPPAYYFHDQFTELYNNSDEIIYLDQYAIGDVAYGYREDDPHMLHCIHLYQFPGQGMDYPLYPGEMIVVAQDAVDHLEYNTRSVDLSAADFEYYNHLSSDIDNHNVPNMVQLHHKYGHDFLYSVFNDAVVLFELTAADTTWTYDSFNHVLVPVERVVDGVEYREITTQYQYKRLPDKIDSGIGGGIPAYKGKSIIRKVFRQTGSKFILMDNNNSSVDFKVSDQPTPAKIDG